MPIIDATTSTTAPDVSVYDLPVEEQYRLSLKPAEVLLKVTEFKDIFHAPGTGLARCTTHTMAMKKPHSRVYVDLKGDLHIRPLGATIRLTLTPNQYFPIGIAFALRDGIAAPTRLERLGLLNFQQLTLLPDQNTLAITDRFKEEDGGEFDDEYKFSVVVQDGNTGRIGIIDPMMIHDPR